MTAKEYLGQAYHIDQRIDSKIMQTESLHALATKATATLNDAPVSNTKNTHSMEDVIIKIIELENEINHDIDELVDLKKEITEVIKKVKNPECQTLLEKRYLCFEGWEQIATDMYYSVQHVFHLHSVALKEIYRIMPDKSK